jgi:hypothetical protein
MLTKPDVFSIDSGHTLMYGPADEVKAFYSVIPGLGVQSHNDGKDWYDFPCLSVLTIAFNWGGKDWTVSKEKYVCSLCDQFSFTDSVVALFIKLRGNRCVGALVGEPDCSGRVWLFSDSFMKNVYTSFDFGTKQVGFATLA